MTSVVNEAVHRARKFFGIEDFPGNIFSLLEKGNYIEEYGLLLFKEDIGKLSGFIGYGDNGLTVICINYQRPLAHQNFTLAHELGHWFLHKGKHISDDEDNMFSTDEDEKEANAFAAELLYPQRLFEYDYSELLQKGLLQEDKRKELAEYIDILCHKYCLSFELVLRKILYRHREASKFQKIRGQIVKALEVKKISEYFDKDFYVPNEALAEYRQSRKPYEELEKRIDMLVSAGKIGVATAESIKIRNGIDIE